MTTLPAKPFNPEVSPVPRLDATTGDPAAFRDPNSIASMGQNIQSMSDQLKADTLYDAAPPPRKEAYQNFEYAASYDPTPFNMVGTEDPELIERRNVKYNTWISRQAACKPEMPNYKALEGFENPKMTQNTVVLIAALAAACGLVLCSFVHKG
jgi:hypothetical protein